jgi:hypothetical protein
MLLHHKIYNELNYFQWKFSLTAGSETLTIFGGVQFLFFVKLSSLGQL